MSIIQQSISDNNEILSHYEIANSSFEQYEQAVRSCKNKNISWHQLSEFQSRCLSVIDNFIHMEERDIYFSAFLNIREELFQQINLVENLTSQITINDITIFPISNEMLAENPAPVNEYKHKTEQTSTELAKPLNNPMVHTIITPNSRGLCDIAGLKTVKSLLKEAVIFPLQFPHLFTGNRKPWNKVLLYGPPGTGKTQLAHSLAAEINATFYRISSADFLSRYVGESEKLIRTLFQYCQQSRENSIVFFDEIDSLCRKRTSNDTDFDRRLKNELLTQISELNGNSVNIIFFIAATNCPWDLDAAFIRRFQRRIYIPLPNRNTRLEIFKLQSESINFAMDKWTEILNETEGWSGSDISELINCAMYQPLKDLDDAKYWILTTENKYMPVKIPEKMSFETNIESIPKDKITVRPVEANDFFVALKTITRTVSQEEIQRFEVFNQGFGTLKNILKD